MDAAFDARSRNEKCRSHSRFDLRIDCGRSIKVGKRGALHLAQGNHDIRWNPDTSEWVCIRCRQTSDHTNKRDAETELSAFDCIPVSLMPDST